MIGLALSGGGSRAIAFHLGCLRALNELGLLDKINVISTISGGSVIGAYYAYTPEKSFSEFESDINCILRRGFHRSILCELIKPVNFIRSGANLLATIIGILLSQLQGTEPYVQRSASLSDMFQKVLHRDIFKNLKMSSRRRHDIDIVIGACELRKGIAFRFGNNSSGDWRHGKMVEWDVDLSFAVAASAAYPIFLPPFDRKWLFEKDNVTKVHRVLITDGGVYDNLGLQVLEPDRDSDYSSHSFSCEYLIVCNAGQGQEGGSKIPLCFLPRVRQSFQTVYRKVQNDTMRKLHDMKNTGKIAGFIMPYLGQLDHQIPWVIKNLIPRDEVIGYPTNFAPMSDKWIDTLSLRGEQLTNEFARRYLQELL
jgi:NTE family protein